MRVTVREFTCAKLIVNLSTFTAFWLAITAAAFYFIFMPLGAMPFVTMVFMGGFLAYTLILSVGLVSQKLGLTVLCIVLVMPFLRSCSWN